MKKEVMDAMEAAKQDLIVRLMKQEQEFVAQAKKFEERLDYKTALRYALDALKTRKKREAIERTEAVHCVVSNEDAFEFFFDRVKEYVSGRMKMIHHQLFLMVMRPWEARKDALNNALIDIELVASDLEQFKDRYPALVQPYINQLRTVPNDVDAILKEIA